MSKRPRLPANLDDDEAVERYLSAVQKENAKSVEASEASRTSGLDARALETEVAGKVAQIVANIIAVRPTNLYLHVYSPKYEISLVCPFSPRDTGR